MAPALAARDESLFAQDRVGTLGGALCHPVFLLQSLHCRKPPPQLSALDLPAQDRRELHVKRRHRIVIEIIFTHMVTLSSTHGGQQFQVSMYDLEWTHVKLPIA